MGSLRATVKQGQIIVNQVFAHVVHEDCIVIEIDCSSKYPELGGTGSTSLMLMCGEHTLRGDPDAEATEIDFYGLPSTLDADGEHWTIHAETGRYSVFVTLFRTRSEGPILFQREG